jgi:membrane-bound lytic murein transglycosylase D
MLIGLVGLAVFCQASPAVAQGPEAPKQVEADSAGLIAAARFVKDSSKAGKRDTATIQLSPVPVAAAHQFNNLSDQYTTLQPVATLTPENFISGNLNTYVVKYINNFYQDNTITLRHMQSRGGTYFGIIEKVFDEYGIPGELKYLAVIESGLNTHARSRAGAVGTWQLMAGTARLLGLQVSSKRDDRKDLYKSTIAAAKYLNRLYDRFDNWLLVIAAYNCGPGGVLKAMDESGSTDFWDLKKYLPSESQKHVMKFLATAFILDRFASFFGVDNPKLLAEDFQPQPTTSIDRSDLAILRISGKYSLPVIAKYTSMSISELNKINPGFDQMISGTSGVYDLHLPADKMVLFKSHKNAILNESVDLLMENNRQIAEAAYPAPKQLPSKG